MRVLVSSYASQPFGPSESFVGWNALLALAKEHELWVLTCSRWRQEIEEATFAGKVPENIRFIFHGEVRPWNPNRLVARIQSWLEYLTWTNSVLPVARKLNQELHFDLIHHVTYSAWRVGSPLWKVGPPFVWGPVGGVATMPPQMMKSLSLTARVFETALLLANQVGKWSPSVRSCAKNSAVVLASNQETQVFLSQLCPPQKPPLQCWPAYYSAQRIQELASAGQARDMGAAVLKIFAGGNLEGRKGVGIALEALALAKAKGVRFCYRLGGGGPELNHLRAKVQELGLQEEVIFGQSLGGEEYLRELGQSHLFLLPSFRENLGLTMVDAMLAGCMPIVANASAQAEIVKEECGFRIPLTSIPEMAAEIANCLILLDKNRSQIELIGKAAQQRAIHLFSEESYRNGIRVAYECALRRAQGN